MLHKRVTDRVVSVCGAKAQLTMRGIVASMTYVFAAVIATQSAIEYSYTGTWRCCLNIIFHCGLCTDSVADGCAIKNAEAPSAMIE